MGNHSSKMKKRYKKGLLSDQILAESHVKQRKTRPKTVPSPKSKPRSRTVASPRLKPRPITVPSPKSKPRPEIEVRSLPRPVTQTHTSLNRQIEFPPTSLENRPENSQSLMRTVESPSQLIRTDQRERPSNRSTLPGFSFEYDIEYD